MRHYRFLTVLALLLAVVLAACGGQQPTAMKPGAFELTGTVQCIDGVHGVQVTWTASSGAASYQLLKDGEPLGGQVTTRSFTDPGPFTIGESYTYVVRATNPQGSTDSNSWTASIAECGTDGEPTEKPGAFELSGSVQCTEGVLGVQLTWAASSGAASYKVYRDGTAQGGAVNALSHTDSGPFTMGTSHEYLVRASNAQGTTDSNTWTAEIPVCELPVTVGVVSIAIGQNHALAALADGRVLSWGTNKSGSLGHLGVAEDEIVELRFIDGLEDIKSVAVGNNWSLALDNDGVVWSWGNNQYGQLGDGTTTARFEPQQIGSLTSTIQSIVVGASYALALTDDGQVYGWGRNNNGQLGDAGASNEPRLEPELLDGLSGVAQLAAGTNHALALHTDQSVSAWGSNSRGQLGRGNLDTGLYAPSTVTGLTTVQILMVAAGAEHSGALTSSGDIYTWGDNWDGQLGTGNGGIGARSGSPQLVTLPATGGADMIAAGAARTFARDAGGNWWGWGRAPGDGTGQDYDSPVRLDSDVAFNLLVTAAPASLAVDSDGRLYAWGSSLGGHVPFGFSGGEATPVAVSGLSGVRQVAVGNGHTLAVTEAGDVYSWGLGNRGQLGHGDRTSKLIPTRIEGLSDALAVAAGYDHSLVLLNDGTAYAFGSNEFGQLGLGADEADRLVPVAIEGLTGVSVITAAYWHSLAVRSAGEVVAWGRGSSYVLGLGDQASRTVPTAIPDLGGVTDLSTGSGHTLALTAGGMYAWGSGINGQLGNGDSGTGVFSGVPVPVPSMTAPSLISASSAASLAIQDGQLWSWGDNQFGVLANGDTGGKEESPVQQTTLTGVSDLSTGDHHGVALLDDGSVYTWGAGDGGQLGNGTITEDGDGEPGQILAGQTVTAVFAGRNSSFALLQNGSLLAWGSNGYGQLGNGKALSYYSPQPIPVPDR